MIDDLDEGLQRLLALIRGGLWPGARGIATYPNEADDGQSRLHAGCLELERRGLICREKEGEGWIFWRESDERESDERAIVGGHGKNDR